MKLFKIGRMLYANATWTRMTGETWLVEFYNAYEYSMFGRAIRCPGGHMAICTKEDPSVWPEVVSVETGN